ncbi:WbuC family cupin fold metalloprotein [Pseudomonas putida]|uniref:WbuC family cupin fold metalloprotein n=1 Tax=Pseudomonas putida TaxID=303 RepID=A0A7W2KZZ5_PSEPU|nr:MULTISPECIES: WbuC family cupin fold metalloprotein [Pseudomonas]MBA6115822.1 WbuC family cupin fold metalloprotein [Pseudomonas putida]MBI6943259.1 WbuC family cupin fold metalloprotein [Pseudomonas putida]MBI6959432.1 WbuC family cupin fold metalloprotein [Pseudomonas putida]MCZ9638049.1 WbuC family cupin fold metalloprotein [Pseudomonas putida]MEC4874142.1 WbuC family cupin fold metalloprotein [Pseudomonas sp. NC26]
MRQPAFIDQSLFAGLVQKAADAPRGRYHYSFHETLEPCHRLAVGMQPCTYVAPHRHLSDDKAETLLALKGRLGILVFDEHGEVIGKRVLQAGGDCIGVDIPPRVYHSLVVLEADSILFDCKAGPYTPLGEGEHAPWAPREGEDGVATYHAWMIAQFE